MITRKNFLIATLSMCLFSFTSCSNDERDLVETQESLKETKFPVVIDENNPQKDIVVNGKTYKIRMCQKAPETRGIGSGEETIYPRDPNATLASKPRLVSKGKYKKYYQNTFSPFAGLQGVNYVLLRLDKFSFECKAPANANPMSFYVENITKQGFSTESASFKGYSIDKTLVTTTGVILKCSFYIQNGAAYNIIGQQLTPNTAYPLPGEDVQYQFTYQIKK